MTFFSLLHSRVFSFQCFHFWKIFVSLTAALHTKVDLSFWEAQHKYINQFESQGLAERSLVWILIHL